jgi:hypothetical protein
VRRRICAIRGQGRSLAAESSGAVRQIWSSKDITIKIITYFFIFIMFQNLYYSNQIGSLGIGAWLLYVDRGSSEEFNNYSYLLMIISTAQSQIQCCLLRTLICTLE